MKIHQSATATETNEKQHESEKTRIFATASMAREEKCGNQSIEKSAIESPSISIIRRKPWKPHRNERNRHQPAPRPSASIFLAEKNESLHIEEAMKLEGNIGEEATAENEEKKTSGTQRSINHRRKWNEREMWKMKEMTTRNRRREILRWKSKQSKNVNQAWLQSKKCYVSVGSHDNRGEINLRQ